MTEEEFVRQNKLSEKQLKWHLERLVTHLVASNTDTIEGEFYVGQVLAKINVEIDLEVYNAS